MIEDIVILLLIAGCYFYAYKFGRAEGYKDAVKERFGELLGDCPPPNPQKEAKE